MSPNMEEGPKQGNKNRNSVVIKTIQWSRKLQTQENEEGIKIIKRCFYIRENLQNKRDTIKIKNKRNWDTVPVGAQRDK